MLMLCVFCIYLAKMGKMKTAFPATCQVRGTSLCTSHAMFKLENANILNDVALINGVPIPNSPI